ncbi:hypothetical protein J6590_022632, partial [Homalodisca vitripennis]
MKREQDVLHSNRPLTVAATVRAAHNPLETVTLSDVPMQICPSDNLMAGSSRHPRALYRPTLASVSTGMFQFGDHSSNPRCLTDNREVAVYNA